LYRGYTRIQNKYNCALSANCIDRCATRDVGPLTIERRKRVLLKNELLASELMMKFTPGEKGFTLLEIIAVLVILSVLAAVAVPRYLSLDESARQRAIDAGIAELNGRETLTWSNIKITSTGYETDVILYGQLNYTLGGDYTWGAGARPPCCTGDTLAFRTNTIVPLTRTESNETKPGSWSR
ncbi:MAG: type II secretion system GspH family protein, partial [Desulfobacterales bacterium]|nr:type II secretion system GspH family protein [Desulfobacterales bacterium]